MRSDWKSIAGINNVDVTAFSWTSIIAKTACKGYEDPGFNDLFHHLLRNLSVWAA